MPLPTINYVWVARARKANMESLAVSETEERALELAILMLKEGYEVAIYKTPIT